jgi:Ca2+-binding EF-hand superfamily protein
MEDLRNEETIKLAFDLMDQDQDGNIDMKDLENFISIQGLNYSQQDLQEIIKKIDLNDDGKIQFSEFKRAMNDGIQMISCNLS